jgi:hypothetical protein
LERCIAGEVGTQHLDGNGAVQSQVASFSYIRHAAVAEQFS